jgi:hypothetical protein
VFSLPVAAVKTDQRWSEKANIRVFVFMWLIIWREVNQCAPANDVGRRNG